MVHTLMIGNIVSYKGNLIRVDKITSKAINGDLYWKQTVFKKQINPIKLTTEIFESIGLKESFCEILKTNMFKTTDGRIVIDGYYPNAKSWNVHIDNSDMCTIGGACIEYLHELQNICTLCDYELDIEVEKLNDVAIKFC